MNNTLKTMIKLWNMDTMDWLGYDNLERYSFHHIKKKCNGGEQTVNNGAVLHQSSHTYLHVIEHYDYEKYFILNNILKDINRQRYMPTIDQLKEIRNILLTFEKDFDGKLSSREKPIIKKEYKLDLTQRL